MYDAITDVAGIEVGQVQDVDSLTGCTVVLCRGGAVVGVDVRGSAPGTRETDLCRPATLVERAQAILLTGGSAFGLDAAGGVVRYLYENGLGFDTGIIKVPIVPGAVIFDLGIGKPVWPDGAMGYRAASQAAGGPVAQGCVGAGTGATVGKLQGLAWAVKSGIGTASERIADITVGAIVAVNAMGDVLASNGQVLAGGRGNDTDETKPPAMNTTIGVVATDAQLDPERAQYLAVSGQTGLARTIRPVHTLYDGDTLFALATGRGPAPDPLLLGTAAARAVERAVRAAVLNATPLGGLPALG
ncbi:MAG TPA: P1 family peptidase [Chloroflexota bacterium]|nr:P1 family peptidase [Chloroflexota bacterium]